MKTAKELELSLLIKEANIQQLKLKINKLEEELRKYKRPMFDIVLEKQARIDKAIEYIENNDYCDAGELLEILKGEDNE